MTLLPPGSSELSQPAAAKDRAAQTAAAAAPALAVAPPVPDDGPLPDPAAADELQLLVQSPYRLYTYWNYAHDPRETLRRAIGPSADAYRLVIRLVDTETGYAVTGEASPAHNYWFDALPGREYRAELGFEAADGQPFVHLLSSAVEQTPPVGVAPEAEEAPPFAAPAGEFAQVLNEAGYAADALAVALEAADTAAADAGDAPTRANTLALAHTLARAPLPLELDLNELRALIVALAFDEPLAHVRAALSPALARWLDALVADSGGHADPARLLELLREMFGFELEFDEEAGGAAAVPHPSSPAWSASDVRQPERRVRVWLPSMAAGAAPPMHLRPLRPSSLGGSDSWLPSMSARQHAPLLRWKKLIGLRIAE
ncbi:MAG TPA: DUF4912 domain-containing protein [Pyrinomonadaceae bacterium]|jgi:hypothetical protein